MDILTYISQNYKLKSIEDIIYDGYGCSWGVDLNGKRFEKIHKSSLTYKGRGCSWFNFDGHRFNCIDISDKRHNYKLRDFNSDINSSNSNSCNNRGDDLMDFLTDPSEPLNPLNPFSPISIFSSED